MTSTLAGQAVQSGLNESVRCASEMTDDLGGDPPYASEFVTRDTSEEADARHRERLGEVATSVLRVVEKTGVLPLLESQPDLSFDEAFERLYGRRRSTRLVNNLLISFHEVFLSASAAISSPREDLIGTIVGIQPALELTTYFLELYSRYRPHEVLRDEALGQLLGRATVHDEEHDAFVVRELRGCISDASALITRLRGLCAALTRERPDTVDAGTYAEKGGGAEAELVMRMVNRCADPKTLGAVLGRVKLPKKSCKGKRRTNLMRQRFSDLSKAILKQAARASEAISSIQQQN